MNILVSGRRVVRGYSLTEVLNAASVEPLRNHVNPQVRVGVLTIREKRAKRETASGVESVCGRAKTAGYRETNGKMKLCQRRT